MSIHEYQVRSRKDGLGVHLISDALPFRCALLSGKNVVADAIDYAKLFSGSHAVIRVYNAAGKLIETHEHRGDFKEYRVHAREANRPHDRSIEHIGGLASNGYETRNKATLSEFKARTMTFSKYDKLPPDEKEHFFQCPECGQFVNKRELRDVIFHVTDHKPKHDIPGIKGKPIPKRPSEPLGSG